MATFKINAKTTVDTLKGLLNANFSQIKALKSKEAKDLLATINYAKEHADKAQRTDFVDMVKTTIKILGEKFIAEPVMAEEKKPVEKTKEESKTTKKVVAKKSEKSAPVENSVKKPVRSKAVKEAEEDTEDEEVEEKTEKTAAKKPAKKSVKKKTKGVEVLEGADAPRSLQLAKRFPQTIEVDGDKYEIDHDVAKIEDLLDGEFEIAFYWTKRHLRQFPYFNGYVGQPKSFPNDLDTAQLIYVSDEGKIAHAVSDATEGIYSILPVDMEEIDGVRFSAGIEFQIYRKIEEDEEE